MMPKLPIWAWVGIAVIAAYLAWRLMCTSKAQSWGPIKIAYDKIGQAITSTGIPYNWTNPGR